MLMIIIITIIIIFKLLHIRECFTLGQNSPGSENAVERGCMQLASLKGSQETGGSPSSKPPDTRPSSSPPGPTTGGKKARWVTAAERLQLGLGGGEDRGTWPRRRPRLLARPPARRAPPRLPAQPGAAAAQPRAGPSPAAAAATAAAAACSGGGAAPPQPDGSGEQSSGSGGGGGGGGANFFFFRCLLRAPSGDYLQSPGRPSASASRSRSQQRGLHGPRTIPPARPLAHPPARPRPFLPPARPRPSLLPRPVSRPEGGGPGRAGGGARPARGLPGAVVSPPPPPPRAAAGDGGRGRERGERGWKSPETRCPRVEDRVCAVSLFFLQSSSSGVPPRWPPSPRTPSGRGQPEPFTCGTVKLETLLARAWRFLLIALQTLACGPRSQKFQPAVTQPGVPPALRGNECRMFQSSRGYLLLARFSECHWGCVDPVFISLLTSIFCCGP
ncbi:uncharacterized protein LOC102924791 [Peromyscus maniculatus bairdii]|uniref:uncharacterized protein LOC102924791 n=1 Tax=Peromyscus maniculatus bairdii TaxID=230844 RepID=UPI003FD49E51